MVRKILKIAASHVPGLKAPHAKTSKRISGHRTVPRKFIRSIMSAVDDQEALRRISEFDTADAKAALQFEEAFRPVIDELEMLRSSLTYTIDLRIARVTEKALRAYVIAKGLARDGSNRQLTTRLRRIKADLGRKGPKKKKGA